MQSYQIWSKTKNVYAAHASERYRNYQCFEYYNFCERYFRRCIP